jgi:hypothetical protein
METKGIERKKVCPNCQTEFSCFTENCWCNELPRVMTLEDSKGCLCPDCLKIAIDNKLNPSE